MISLASNPQHTARLCSELELGCCRGEITPVHGGFHHRMWRLDADRGSFAVKQLSPHHDPSNPQVRDHFTNTETAAAAFASAGIPAVVALRSSRGFLQVIDDSGYLVYPWTDATAAGRNTISADQASRVARMMAAMHRADIQVAGLPEVEFDSHSEENIAALVEWAVQRNVREARELAARLPDMLELVRLQVGAIRILRRHLVISHGDLDHKNVLWTASGEPLLIDWESARWLNPTYELILEALDWSGISGNFKPRNFADFLAAYRRSGGLIDPEAVNASINCVFGDWLNWLMFNVGRAMDLHDPREHSVGSEQIDLAFSTLLRMERQLPRLLAIAREQADGVNSHV